jgi:hypothetical protein
LRRGIVFSLLVERVGAHEGTEFSRSTELDLDIIWPPKRSERQQSEKGSHWTAAIKMRDLTFAPRAYSRRGEPHATVEAEYLAADSAESLFFLDDGGESGLPPPPVPSSSSYDNSVVVMVALASMFFSPLRFAGVRNVPIIGGVSGGLGTG